MWNSGIAMLLLTILLSAIIIMIFMQLIHTFLWLQVTSYELVTMKEEI